MVVGVIRDYLLEGEGEKRLALPGFGTFVRRAGRSQISFDDSARTDDGLVGSLVESFGHYAPVEAMALVDRFVFETKRAIEQTGSAVLEGFGVMSLDPKGHYRFTTAPAPPKDGVQRKLFGQEWTPGR